jgi:uncharacterized membrane protein (UPF0127 family)
VIRWVQVSNRSRDGSPVIRARWCESFACRLRGLTFRRHLPENEGLLLVEATERRAGSSIHMWAVFFPIGVAWLGSEGRVVDCRLAHPWHAYIPSAPARYVLEGTTSMLSRVRVGDVLEWVDEATA